jgi:AcrR family transcriptional regulator
MGRATKTAPENGRPNQRSRTRKDLLRAASRLMSQGRSPSLDEVAAEALVSRATAYRYFPNVEALLVEASLDIATPDAAELFGPDASGDPVARLERLDAAMDDMIRSNEPALRTMLVHSLQQRLAGGDGAKVPARQNRRTPLIEAALAPARRQFKPGSLAMLERALALVIGTEAMLVCKDVLELDDDEARRLKRWAIRALVLAARKEAKSAAARPAGARAAS